MSEPVNMTVVIDQNSDECLYVDGVCWHSPGEGTVYVTDLVHHADGRLIRLVHHPIEHIHDSWPVTLAEAIVPPDGAK